MAFIVIYLLSFYIQVWIATKTGVVGGGGGGSSNENNNNAGNVTATK